MRKTLAILLTIIPLMLVAQVTEEWVARFEEPSNIDDAVSAIGLDNTGNVYITGRCNDDFATIKYNSEGAYLWAVSYNGTGDSTDGAEAIAIDEDGNVIVTGWSVESTFHHDLATIKYNTAGEELWVATYDGPNNGEDAACAIALDTAGNIFVTGVSEDDYVTVMYNSFGEKQWATRYNNGSQDHACAIAVDAVGNVYVTGYSWGIFQDYTTIKYNTEGGEEWIARYNGPDSSYDQACDIAVDGTGNVYVTGWSIDTSTSYDYATIMYNTHGEEQWVARYDGPANRIDWAQAIAVNTENNIFVTGWSVDSSGYCDYATVKYNNLGEQEWVTRYNGPGNEDDRAYDIELDAFSNVYITGTSQGSSSSYSFDYSTVKYNPQGEEKWVVRYNGSDDSIEGAVGLAIDSLVNVFVTGNSYVSDSLSYVTIKYSQGTGVAEGVEPEVSVELEVSAISAQPEISYVLPGPGPVSVNVYDVSGQLVAELVSGHQDAGTHSLIWDAETHPRGLYFVRLEAGSVSVSERLILIK